MVDTEEKKFCDLPAFSKIYFLGDRRQWDQKKTFFVKIFSENENPGKYFSEKISQLFFVFTGTEEQDDKTTKTKKLHSKLSIYNGGYESTSKKIQSDIDNLFSDLESKITELNCFNKLYENEQETISNASKR